MAEIPNLTTGNATIVFHDKNLNRIIPDKACVHVSEGTSVEWVIIPPNETSVEFKGDSPFDWHRKMSTGKHEKISGVVREGAVREKPYKYVVTDSHGNVIDPRLQIKG